MKEEEEKFQQIFSLLIDPSFTHSDIFASWTWTLGSGGGGWRKHRCFFWNEKKETNSRLEMMSLKDQAELRWAEELKS